MSELSSLEERARSALAACGDESALRAWHGRYFGSQGEVLDALKTIGTLPKEERKAYGVEANRIKEGLTQAYEAALPGMCYRYEAITTRSEIMFHQVEGLAIGERITMTDLKGTIIAFARRMFGEQRQVRIRSSYFPFTEPSIEVDMDCIVCAGKGCSLCKGTGWLEIMGAGMVHPVVLRNGGYDPEKFSGFAFGMGPQRIAQLKYAIDDIRQFWGNDLRFLRQF